MRGLAYRPRFGVVRPTPVGTHRFRSRLEARWAVFLSELGLAWEYEPERVSLPDGRTYTPDFRIGTLWLEVKGPEPIQEEVWKCEELARLTGTPVSLAIGDPFYGDIGVFDGGHWWLAGWGIVEGRASLVWNANRIVHSPSLRRAATRARQAYFR